MNRQTFPKWLLPMLLIAALGEASSVLADPAIDSSGQPSTLFLSNDSNKNGIVENTEIATVPANAINQTEQNVLVIDLDLVQGYMPARQTDESSAVVIWNDTNSDGVVQGSEITQVPTAATQKAANNALTVDLDLVQGYMPARQ